MYIKYSHTRHVERQLPVSIRYCYWRVVATFVAEEVIRVSCQCRIVEKSPPYGVVVDSDVELMFHSTDEPSNRSVALLRTQISYIIHRTLHLCVLS